MDPDRDSIQRATQANQSFEHRRLHRQWPAYGEGFGFLTRASEDVSHLADKASLLRISRQMGSRNTYPLLNICQS